MKMRIACDGKKCLAVCFLMCGLVISAQARQTALTLKNGRATVRKSFQPRRQADADLYFLRLRRGQTVKIKVDANGVYLTKENECSMYFELFDGAGEGVFIGDDMVGIDSWEGEIKETGNHKIKVSMHCIESFTTKEVRKKKPSFKYSLVVQMK